MKHPQLNIRFFTISGGFWEEFVKKRRGILKIRIPRPDGTGSAVGYPIRRKCAVVCSPAMFSHVKAERRRKGRGALQCPPHRSFAVISPLACIPHLLSSVLEGSVLDCESDDFPDDGSDGRRSPCTFPCPRVSRSNCLDPFVSPPSFRRAD